MTSMAEVMIIATVLANKISQCCGDERETAFLFQRISVLLLRYNSILLHDSFVREECPKKWSLQQLLILFFPNPSGFLTCTEGK